MDGRDVQIADADRKISTIYDMLDEQDATNRDAKGLPFTVSIRDADEFDA